MCLFERRASYRPESVSWRDAAARILDQLATNGVPMSLQSLKAYSDLAARTMSRPVAVASERPTEAPFRLARPVAPAAGLV